MCHPVLANGEFDKAREIVSRDKSTISQMLGMGLARMGAVRRREDIEIAMEESMMEIIPQLEKRTPYVALLANIATLLGLLGTIMGLIEAFTAVGKANPAEKADLLSASISVAMNTTAFGLISVIPLLLFHVKLTSTTGQIVDTGKPAPVHHENTAHCKHEKLATVVPDECVLNRMPWQSTWPSFRMSRSSSTRLSSALSLMIQKLYNQKEKGLANIS